MKKILTVCTLVLIGCLYFCATGRAEVIYLNNGKVVKGKIVEDGPYHIVVEENGIPRKYYDEQVERIEQDEMDTSGVDFDKYLQEGIMPEKARLIVTLINVSGMRANIQQTIESTLERAPVDQRVMYENIFDIDEIIELLIPLYDKYYSAADVQAIVNFYQSSAGQRAIEVTPQVMQESLDLLIQYVEEKTQ